VDDIVDEAIDEVPQKGSYFSTLLRPLSIESDAIKQAIKQTIADVSPTILHNKAVKVLVSTKSARVATSRE
jgi:hypothetical protein